MKIQRHVKIYNSTRKWLAFLFQHERAPGNPKGTLAPGQLQMEIGLATEFMEAVEMAQFLFSPHVAKQLNEISREGKTLSRHQRRHASLSDEVVAGEVLKLMDDALDRLFEVDARLADIFGEEIRLTLPAVETDFGKAP